VGKYTKLRGKIPKFSEPDADQVRLDKRKKFLTDELELTNLEALGKFYLGRKGEKDRLEALQEEVKLDTRAAAALLEEKLAEAGIDKFTLKDGGTISLNPEVYSSIEDQSALLRWVREQGMEHLLTLNYQTLSGMVKNRVANGEELPAGVSVFLREKVHRSGGQKDEVDE